MPRKKDSQRENGYTTVTRLIAARFLEQGIPVRDSLSERMGWLSHEPVSLRLLNSNQ
jgi:hypothetical protein